MQQMELAQMQKAPDDQINIYRTSNQNKPCPWKTVDWSIDLLDSLDTRYQLIDWLADTSIILLSPKNTLQGYQFSHFSHLLRIEHSPLEVAISMTSHEFQGTRSQIRCHRSQETINREKISRCANERYGFQYTIGTTAFHQSVLRTEGKAILS